MRRVRHRQHGFTLVEILVAMAVIAIGLVALVGASGRSTQTAAELRDRTYAQWVAANAMTELRLDPGIDEESRQDGEEQLAGEWWQWQADISDTPDPDLLRIDVRVARGDSGSIVTLTGFKARPDNVAAASPESP